MRIIDADALIDKYGDWYTEEGTEEGYIGTIKGIVDSMPTVEPERKKGKWEMKWHSFFKREVPTCSVCKAGFFFITNFCPKCGAEMWKGEQCENS